MGFPPPPLSFLCFLFFLLSLACHHTVQSFAPTSQTATRIQQKRPSNTKLHTAEAIAVIDSFFQTSPYAAAALTCGLKASAADLVAQKRSSSEEQGQPTTDLKRNVAFVLYGAIYQGVAQEFIYNHLYNVLFGSGLGWQTVMTKVVVDLGLQSTLVTLPILYLSKALIFQYSLEQALRNYRDDILYHGLLKKYFLLWGPVQCLTFGVVPEHYRVAFIACVSFFWLIILSTIAARGEPEPKR